MRFFSNPVLARELRGRIRGRRAMVMLVVYLAITAALTLLVYATIAGSFASSVNDPEEGRVAGKGIFLAVMSAMLVQVCVISPLLTAGAIAGERERQTYDLLLISLLSPAQIILGKLAAAIAFTLLLIIAALPLAGLAFFFGGVSGTELLIGMIGILVTAVCYAAVGMFWSTLMRTTIAATVFAQGTVIAILLGVPFVFVIISLSTDWSVGLPSLAYVYVVGLLFSLHPFIALGITAESLIRGRNPFFFEISTRTGDILVPSPWITYTALGVILTGLFLFLSIRLLKPTEYAAPRPKTAS